MIKIKVNGVEIEVDGNFKLGYTISTSETRKWSKEELEENNAHEEKRVFANFNPDDQGRSRVLICECKTAGQAMNVLSALRITRLDTKFELAETIYKLISTNELADQSDSMLISAIDAMMQIGTDPSEMQALLDARAVLKDLEYEWKKLNRS